MKLKVQFIRSKGWSPEIRLLSAGDPRIRPETSTNHPTLLRPHSRRYLRVLNRDAIPTAVPGRPEAGAVNKLVF